MQLMQTKYTESLPDLSVSQSVIITSDYSGENKKSPFQIYSFLFTEIDSCLEWNTRRNNFRQSYFADNRRISFKNLNDTQREKALIPFLEMANHLNGLSFTVAIDNSIGTIFSGPAPLDLENKEFDEFAIWKPLVLEKAFRILHFISFFIAGLSSEGQNIYWFSDEDNIAANPARLSQLTKVFASILGGYLTINLGHIKCGTTENDDGTLLIEDLAAIPDLIAGAVNEQLIVNENNPGIPDAFWIMSPDYSRKTTSITWWLADANKPLKRLFCSLRPNGKLQEMSVSWFHFYNQC
jgi:hypothetical protein